MYPPLAKSDVSAFGSAGQFLKDHPLSPIEPSHRVGDAEIIAPKLLKRVDPAFPRGAEEFGISGPLIVEVLIDPSGNVTSPRVLKPLAAPTLSYAALEALKHWRFAPGQLAGQPVPVTFNVTVNFKIP